MRRFTTLFALWLLSVTSVVAAQASPPEIGAGALGGAVSLAASDGWTAMAELEGGSVDIFRYGGDAIIHEARLRAPVGVEAEAHFGAALALDETTLLVGAWGTDEAYVYTRETEVWSLTQTLTGAAGSGFGAHLALSEGTAVVGAALHPVAGTSAGAVYVYRARSGRWQLDARIDAPSADFNGFFGFGLALADDLLVVGAPGTGAGPGGSGAVFLYDLAGPGYDLVARLDPPESVAAYAFGAAVALGAGHVAVGAPGEDYGGNLAGPVFVYDLDRANWSSPSIIASLRPGVPEHFGSALLLAEDRLAVGAFHDHDLEMGDAFVDLYGFDGTTWSIDRSVSYRSIHGRRRPLLAATSDALMIGGLPDSALQDGSSTGWGVSW